VFFVVWTSFLFKQLALLSLQAFYFFRLRIFYELMMLSHNLSETVFKSSELKLLIASLHLNTVNLSESFFRDCDPKITTKLNVVAQCEFSGLLANLVKGHFVTLHDMLLAVEVEYLIKTSLFKFLNINNFSLFTLSLVFDVVSTLKIQIFI
jgi:hypothetical protein